MKKIFLIFALASALLFSFPVYSASPYFFSGYAHINGSLAPNGTIVEVAVNGFNKYNVTMGEGTLFGKAAGYYLISFEADSGNNVTFQLNGRPLLNINGTDNTTQILTSSNIIANFNLSANKTASTNACEVPLACTGGFCVHSVCRDASTFCGDSACDSDETCTSCSTDCGACASSGGGGGGGGSGGGGGGGLPSSTNSVNNVAANTPTSVTVTETSLPVSEVQITPSISSANLQVTVKEISSPSTGSPAISLGASGRVYKYIDISVSVAVSSAKVKFKVPKSWLTQNSISAETVSLNRLSSAVWTKLSTTKLSEDATNVYYEATTPGFSNFAITGSKGASIFDVISKIDLYYQGKAAFFDVISAIDLYYSTNK